MTGVGSRSIGCSSSVCEDDDGDAGDEKDSETGN